MTQINNSRKTIVTYLTLTITCYFLFHSPSTSSTQLQQLKTHKDNIDAICISRDSVYTASFDNTIKKTDFATVDNIGSHTDWVRALLCIDDLLVSASNDGFIKIWKNRQLVNKIKAHNWWITDLAYADKKIISISLDEYVKIWSFPDFELLFEKKIYGSHKHHTVTTYFNNVYIGSTWQLYELNLDTHKIEKIDNFYNETYYSSVSDKNYVYFGSHAGKVVKLNPKNNSLLKTYTFDSYAIKALAIENNTLYIGNDNGEIYRIRLSDTEEPELLFKENEAVRYLRVVNDILYAAFDSGILRAYKI